MKTLKMVHIKRILKRQKQMDVEIQWEKTDSSGKQKAWRRCKCVVRLCATPWTVACQVTLSREFSRQEYWSGLPF